MAKLPNDIRPRVARESKGSVWKIDELLELIKQEIEARELSEGVKASEERVSKSGKDNLSNHAKNITAKSLVSNQDQERRDTKIQCAYCKDFHYSASCKKVVLPTERKNILIKSNRCFKCLRVGHQIKECRSPKNCRYCEGHHHQSICLKSKENQESERKNLQDTKNDKSSKDMGSTDTGDNDTGRHDMKNTVTAASTVKAKGNILLQTATAVATNEDNTKSAMVRILLDSGSQRSYVTDSLKSKLGLKTTTYETLHLNTFGEKIYRKQKCQVVNLPLLTSENKRIEISALSFPVICSPLAQKIDADDYPHLQGLHFADSFEVKDSIDILVGSDHYWDIVTGESIRGENGPTAVSSQFGWILSGPTHVPSHETTVTSNLIISGETAPFNLTNENDQVVDMLKKFWEVEGVRKEDMEVGDEVPAKFLQPEEISFNGRLYEVELPWKDNRSPTSTNYRLCEFRLRSLHRKLKSDPELLGEYNKIIQDQLQTNIIERVPESSSEQKVAEMDGSHNQNEKAVHYSPHHAVIRKEHDTTKVRIVYDGSARSSTDELSLNDCLEVGPNYIPLIFNMLAKFRWNLIALAADIEKAFLMVGIKEEQRDMLRFLWFDNPTAPNPRIIQLRFNRLVFGLRPSPSILGETIRHHLRLYKQSEPEMAKLLEESLYVDDLVSGSETINDAFQTYEKSKKIMAEGGFNLRKWKSNSRELLEEITKAESKQQGSLLHETESSELLVEITKAESKQQGSLLHENESSTHRATEDVESYTKSSMGLKTYTESDQNITKILGLNWNTLTDEFCFDFANLLEYANSLPKTKRSILKVTAKIFDPLGFLSPFTVVLKILFQELCVSKSNWDDELNEDVLKRWQNILNELRYLEANRIPRCYLKAKLVQCQVHGFSDASERAYAAVIYVRSSYQDGCVDVRLAASKSKVSPLAKQSIPRLELQGALLLAQLLDNFLSCRKDLEPICWTDSMTTLCWIKNDRLWKQYVQHRVQEIRVLTSKENWLHCPVILNPADLPSRGLSAKEISTNETWWNGPEFLYHPESEWPSNQPTSSLTEATLKEAVKNPPSIIHSLTANSVNDEIKEKIEEVMDVNRFCNLAKLLRVTALVVKFITMLKERIRVAAKTRHVDFAPNVLNLEEAEKLWIKSIQASSFAAELKFLRNKPNNTSPPVYVNQFGLFLDEEIIKCKGRMNNSSLSDNSKNPVLLPTKHPL